MMNKTQVRAASLVLQEGGTHATLCFYKDSSKNEKIMTVQSKRTDNSDAQKENKDARKGETAADGLSQSDKKASDDKTQPSEKKPQEALKSKYPNLFSFLHENSSQQPRGGHNHSAKSAAAEDSPLSEALGKLQGSQIGGEKDHFHAAERLLINALKKSFQSAVRLRREATAAAVINSQQPGLATANQQ